MKRRAFLSALAGAFVADPEKLLWVPGKKLISIPKPKQVEPIDFETFLRRYITPAARSIAASLDREAMMLASLRSTSTADWQREFKLFNRLHSERADQIRLASRTPWPRLF